MGRVFAVGSLSIPDAEDADIYRNAIEYMRVEFPSVGDRDAAWYAAKLRAFADALDPRPADGSAATLEMIEVAARFGVEDHRAMACALEMRRVMFAEPAGRGTVADMLRAAVLAERESCAKTIDDLHADAESLGHEIDNLPGVLDGYAWGAAAIRARE